MTAPPQWLLALYQRVDAGRIEDYIDEFAPDAVIRFGSNPPATGTEEIRRSLGAGHQRHRMNHTLKRVWVDGDTVVCEFDVVYTMRLDGRTFELPTATVIRRDPVDGLIHEMRIYLDPTPMASERTPTVPRTVSQRREHEIDG